MNEAFVRAMINKSLGYQSHKPKEIIELNPELLESTCAICGIRILRNYIDEDDRLHGWGEWSGAKKCKTI